MENESCLANSAEIGPRTAFGIETLLDEQANNLDLAENLDVDIIECTNTTDNTGLAEVEDPYATEYSSSFDDTMLQSEVVMPNSSRDSVAKMIGHLHLMVSVACFR